jgi:hypothetical protein
MDANKVTSLTFRSLDVRHFCPDNAIPYFVFAYIVAIPFLLADDGLSFGRLHLYLPLPFPLSVSPFRTIRIQRRAF